MNKKTLDAVAREAGGEGMIDEKRIKMSIKLNRTDKWYGDPADAEALEELLMLREKIRWIPVGERLPENEYEKVLGYDGHHIFMTYMVGTFFDFDTVTHWMPLPEHPGKEKE